LSGYRWRLMSSSTSKLKSPLVTQSNEDFAAMRYELGRPEARLQ
jgi:hypothetical protein